MCKLRQVTIVGLGLIGGSIARALRTRTPDVVLIAVDREEVRAHPGVTSTVDRFVEISSSAEHGALISKSDIVILCQPVRVIADTIGAYVNPRTVVTDTGSTKRHIVDQARALPGQEWFVPGHPMAGREVGGFENSAPDLFEDRPWILCIEGREPTAVRNVEMLLELLGARKILMSPEEHDRAVATVSHVPQVLSSWLQVLGSRRNASTVAGPAFRDMTRVAGGAESIWRDILATNSDEIGKALRDGALALASMADALLSDPPQVERVLEMLEQARRVRSRTAEATNPADH
jgi:prephenate dehydrogenase